MSTTGVPSMEAITMSCMNPSIPATFCHVRTVSGVSPSLQAQYRASLSCHSAPKFGPQSPGTSFKHCSCDFLASWEYRFRTATIMSTRSSSTAAFVLISSRSQILFRRARHLYSLGRRRVARDAFVEGFGDLFAIAVAAEFLFVGGTGHEGDFCQDSWHRAFSEDDESRFFDGAIAQAGLLPRQRSVERVLHA